MLAVDITCVTIDCRDPAALARFWARALGWDGVAVAGDGTTTLCRPPGGGTYLEFVQVPEDKTVKNRLHLGCTAAGLDALDDEVERLVALGASIAWEERFPPAVAAVYRNVVLRDPEGNEFCLGAGDPPPEAAAPAVEIRDLTDADRPWLRATVADAWGLPVVTPARVYDHPERLGGAVAEVAGERVGAVTFRAGDGELEVVTVNALRPGIGAGRAMLDEVRRRAAAAGASRVWLVTTDTNDSAIAFYQRLGMARGRVHRRFIDVVRAVKPDLPPDTFSDAVEFEWRLGVTPTH
ncbi:MAG TPA: GNAT family N-acetyltransferase [Acidimicrobiales bacterium]